MHAEAVVGQSAVPAGRRRRSTDPAGPRLFARAPTVRHLTPREHDIALLIADGLDNRAIAARLGLSRGYVDLCVRRIQWRIQLSSRPAIAQWVTARTTDTDPDQLHRVGD